MKVTPADLILQLSTVVDPTLARAAVESYVEMEGRFLAGDWSPAELDGGHLCEAVSRCLLQYDTGILNHTYLLGQIEPLLIDNAGRQSHTLTLADRRHMMKVIGAVWKLRNDRGVAHISPTHSANNMDAMLVLHVGKWIFAELLRLVWNGDRALVTEVIEQLVQLEHSIIHELEGRPLVLAENATAPEEVLVLLNNAPAHRLSRAALRDFTPLQKPDTVRAAITSLIKKKDIRPVADGGELALTPKGQKRVREEIMPKLRKK